MNKQVQSCPWCHAQVKMEPGQRRLYRCPSCNQEFMYSPQPSAEQAQEGVPAPLDFVETPFIRNLVDRILSYLKGGLPVHLRGPAGGGKTTLALHVARLRGRPVVLIHGDDEMGTSDLVGKESGLKRSYTRDQFIHTVLKVEEEAKPLWVGRALTAACQEGHTIVYDEFTRSRPEANNVLLSVLEERVLPLRGGHVAVHPDFRAIFTSNPAEYAGVHSAQDALLDRMVTIHLDEMDQETEVAIAQARSKLPRSEVERVVGLVRAVRTAAMAPGISSIRPSIMISRILHVRGGHAHARDHIFLQACHDVLMSEVRRSGVDTEREQRLQEELQRLTLELCSTPLPSEGTDLNDALLSNGPDKVLSELLRDHEVEQLLLKKLQERGLTGKMHRDSPVSGEGHSAIMSTERKP